MHSFSDFSKEENNLAGSKVPITSILNKPVYILNYRILPSKCRNADADFCVQIQFSEEEGGSPSILFTSSVVLKNMLEKYENEIPFKTCIRKVNNYYTFT